MKPKKSFGKRIAQVVSVLLVLFLLFSLVAYVSAKRMFPMKYQETVQQVSKETGISESLLYAVIHTESGFRPEAESHLGARGLMQLTEDTYDWVKFRKKQTTGEYTDLFIPEVNIQYGAWLLELLTQEFVTETAVLSAYHAGWGNVKKWLGNTEYSSDGKNITKIPFRDTAHYVHKVQRAQRIYQLLYQLP